MALLFFLGGNLGFEALLSSASPCCLMVSQAGSAELPLPCSCAVLSLQILLKLENPVLEVLLGIRLQLKSLCSHFYSCQNHGAQ